MEFVIPGLILVALMVYVSTRIKRTAAAAYEAETIESRQFSIRKPEGFISIANPMPPLLFDAYTKDFGPGQLENDPLITATVRQADEPEAPLSEITSEWHIGDDKVIEGRDGSAWVTRRRAATRSGEILLEIRSVVEPEGENARKIEELLNSFETAAESNGSKN